MKNILREPLLHFLLLGVLIFIAYFVLNPSSAEGKTNQIRITQGDVDRYKQVFQKQRQRSPTADELQGLIEGHLKEEILYREALAMGLEKDDTIVRRRLAQKVEFLIADVAVPDEVNDKELRTYYDKNSKRYARAAQLSFSHIFFSPDLRGERLPGEASATLQTLQEMAADSYVASDYGDRFLLQQQYMQASADDVARDFGQAFADTVVSLPSGSWQGPVESGYGMHLVYVQHREGAGVYHFDDIREQVKNDYLFELRKTRNAEVLDKLKSRYEIVIEGK